MKPSSISLWSMALIGAACAFAPVAEAGWRERAYLDGDLVIESYPPGYLPRGPAVIYPAPRYYGAPLIYGRRGRTVYVDPPLEDEYSYYEELPPDEAYPDGEVAPYPRRQRAAPVPRRANPDETAALPGEEGRRPTVVPGLAPRRQSGPRVVTVRPPAMAAPGTMPTPGRGISPGDVSASNNGTAPAKTAVASVALPVPRPNLEGMDFAPAKPNTAMAPLPQSADEGRR